MDYVSLGRRIRTNRFLSGMTQGQLAEATGVSCSYIGHIERGSRKVSIELLSKIAEALGISVEEIMQEDRRTEGSAPVKASTARVKGGDGQPTQFRSLLREGQSRKDYYLDELLRLLNDIY